MDTHNIKKGTRIRARWFSANMACLAGSQPKFGATLHEVTGTVRHIRGDHPTEPKTIRLYVEADDGTGSPCGKCQVREVEVNPDHVVEVL